MHTTIYIVYIYFIYMYYVYVYKIDKQQGPTV